MAEQKNDSKKTREDRLAEQLRANLRRRKTAARKTAPTASPKKDAPQP
ncbi:hypothetical protein [Algimonas ampicilliniresistens]|nr:hypothetical protein [Algimonas ampicilliniresistens]